MINYEYIDKKVNGYLSDTEINKLGEDGWVIFGKSLEIKITGRKSGMVLYTFVSAFAL